MKKLLFKLAFVVFLSCLFTSCTALRNYAISKENDYKEAFIGAKQNEIVSELGDPDKQTSDGASGAILIYEEKFTAKKIGYMHVFVDEDSVCYNIKTNHQKYVRVVDEVEKEKFTGKVLSCLLVVEIVCIIAIYCQLLL